MLKLHQENICKGVTMQISSIPAIGLRSAIPAQNAMSCQPIKKMSCQPLKKANDFEFAMPFKSVHHNEDGDVAEIDNATMEQKLDLACRIAAYYQQQYEDLKAKGSVEA